jgi:D-ribulokinase
VIEIKSKEPQRLDSLYLALDVGSYSLRAGLFDCRGKMLGTTNRDISVLNPGGDCHEQSSSEIWDKAVDALNEVLDAGDRRKVKGISFDATCSLVLFAKDGKPLCISTSRDPERNIIMWMDHRATREAQFISSTKGEPVRYLGGVVSPEHELPKLLWLKRHLGKDFAQIGEAFDLADYLTYKATGSKVRGNCTLVCKWGYLAHKGEDDWNEEFFKAMDLHDFYSDHLSRYDIKPIGETVGRISAKLSSGLGLNSDCIVATSLIDAHSGGVGSAGAVLDPARQSEWEDKLTQTLVIIMGTSNCHMAVSKDPIFIKGVWGPYYGAMVPGLWLNEGGQNATGSLLDHILRENRLFQELTAGKDEVIFDVMNSKVAELRDQDLEFNKYLNVLPYFYGNRSPRADPTLWGMIDGLRLEDEETAYAKLYLSTIQALAFGSRHIIEEMEKEGYHINCVVATGGHIKNELLLQEHANILERPIYLTEEKENMLLGGAINAATAAGEYATVIEAMANMSHMGSEISPQPERFGYYRKKYQVFKRMYDFQEEIREILK